MEQTDRDELGQRHLGLTKQEQQQISDTNGLGVRLQTSG
jgi:hypothetical protein